MFKKYLTFFLLIVFLITSGFGCKGISAEQQAAVRPVTLNYWTIYNDLPELEQYAAEYMQTYPHVTIKIRRVRYSEFDNLFTNALADDVSPDVISMHTRWLGKYRNRLDTMPTSVSVARVIDKSTAIREDYDIIQETKAMPTLRSIKSAYVNTIYSDIVSGGKAYGLPMAMDTLALYYNKDLLDRAGIPEPPESWDEFVEVVKKVTKFDSDGRVVQAGVALGTSENIENFFDIFSLFLMQSGVQMSQGSVATFADGIEKASYNHPFFKALNFYTDFAKPNKEAYTWNDEMGDAFDEFVRGKSVFYFGYGYEYPSIRSRARGARIEILPVPQLSDDDPINIANYWVESVSKKSKNKDEAWDFIRYMTSPEKVAEYTKATSRPTPLRIQIEEQLKNERMIPFTSQVLFAENWYDGRDIDRAVGTFEKMVADYLKPYTGDPDDRIKRDKTIIINTSMVVQQTM